MEDSQDIITNYGYHDDWWCGHDIDIASEFQFYGDSVQPYARMMVETRRLMAFLDGGSRRPYASVKILSTVPPASSLPSLKGDLPDMVPVGRYLEDLITFWGKDSLGASVFETSALYVPFQETRTFCNFSTEVSLSLSPADTLFDLVDDMVWPLREPPETYLASVGDVITLSLRRDDAQSGAGIDVPMTFYPDRYTGPFLEFAKTLRERRKEYQRRLGLLNNQRFTIMNYMGKDTSKLLQITSEYLGALCSKDEQDNDDEQDSDEEDFDYTGLEAATEDLKHAAELFAQKKSSMVDEMQEIQHQMNRENSLFKGEDDREIFAKIFPDEEYPEMRTFILSGVILSPTEYCFCRRAPPSLIDMSDEPELIEDVETAGVPKREFEWWKVSSSLVNNMQEPTATRVTEEEVIALAKAGSSEYSSQEVILVYATADNAWNTEKHEVNLSPALQTFIEKDRTSLLKKLREEETANVALVGLSSSTDSLNSYSYSATPDDHDSATRIEVSSVKDDDDMEYAESKVTFMPPLNPIKSATSDNIATGIINDTDADAMELEFSQFKPKGE